MTKRTTIGMIAGVLTISVTGIAIGQDQTRGGPATAASVISPVHLGNEGAAHQTSSAALREHLVPAGDEYLANTDWASARSFAIPGTRLRGWTFDQPGKRCLALPDPVVEGYGVTCNTPAEIAAGEATVVILPPTEAKAPNIVGALGAASIETPAGTSSKFERIDDVYIGTAPTGSRLVTASGSHAIDPPERARR